MKNKNKRKPFFRIMDWVAIIIAIFVVIGFIYKVTGGNIDPSSVRSKTTSIKYTLLVRAEEDTMLEHIKIGDQIAESKRDFPLYVTSVEINPLEEDLVVIDEVKADHIAQRGAVAKVVIEGEIELKGFAKRVGKQEISPGNKIFLESRLYKLSSLVLKVEE